MSYYENRIKALEARIEEMAMLNRMKAVSVEKSLMIRIGELNDDNARLKAEVERLTGKLQNLNVFYDEALDKNDNLKAQVERLTKAGDAMADQLWPKCGCPECEEIIDCWLDAKRAAKEGKQP